MKTSKTSHPLGTYLKQFQEHLERQFYRPVTIADYDRCLTALNSKMAELSVSLEQLDEDTAVNLIAKSDLPSCRAKHNRFMVHSFVKFLVSLGVAKPTPESVPADTERGLLKRAYEEYLRRQRGLSERTIFHSSSFQIGVSVSPTAALDITSPWSASRSDCGHRKSSTDMDAVPVFMIYVIRLEFERW